MKLIFCCWLWLSLLLLASHDSALAGPVEIEAGVNAAAQCGYDLAKLRPSIAAATIEHFASSGVKIGLAVRLKSSKQFIDGELKISCIEGSSDATPTDQKVLDAKTVIHEQDAGGRYFRHVASQRLVAGANWRASVATIDYILGDAQKVKANEFLACDADVPRPCISVRIDRPIHLSQTDLRTVHEMIGEISVAAETAGKAGDRQKTN